MKFTTALIALATAAVAVPNGGSPGQCNSDHPYQVCCNTGVLGLVLCNLSVSGSVCDSGSYCCSSAPQNGLINLGLECVKIL
ncbi:hypothetical protein QQS21_006563 [Conoideocrella luteorostrata]|uniref:Hydrophobin n=1 Tax=Conoideocrella luteorostrata TaxID=1105319 RepID=A0AAJ0G039_9HYPO|nr:hypothetical protein QQS21_006563 [Conoideocrella luteorostrata]